MNQSLCLLTSRIYTSLLIVSLTLMVGVTTPHPVDKIKVQIVLDTIGLDEYFESTFTSYVARELRSLGDVEVVEEEADWKLNFTVKQHDKTGHYIIGVVVSIVMDWKRIARMEKPRNVGQIYVYLFNNVYYTTTIEVKDVCEQIITAFDLAFLNLARKQ